jgi:hypothetical protein
LQVGDRVLGLVHLGTDDHVGRAGGRLTGEHHHPEAGVRGDRRAVDRRLDLDPVLRPLLGIDVDEGVRVEIVLAGGDHAPGLVDDLDEHRLVVDPARDGDNAAEDAGPGAGGDVLRPGEVGLVDVADERPLHDHHEVVGAHAEGRRHHQHRQRGGAGPDRRQEPAAQGPEPAAGPETGAKPRQPRRRLAPAQRDELDRGVSRHRGRGDIPRPAPSGSPAGRTERRPCAGDSRRRPRRCWSPRRRPGPRRAPGSRSST